MSAHVIGGVKHMAKRKVKINRAPVLTLWATIVAERLGYDHDAALTLGKAVAGLNAQSKGRRLGLFDEAKHSADQGESLDNVQSALEVLATAYQGERLTTLAYALYKSSARKCRRERKAGASRAN
jgi:hypothetical protein